MEYNTVGQLTSSQTVALNGVVGGPLVASSDNGALIVASL